MRYRRVEKREILPNHVYFGDCLKLMPFIKPKSIDMIFADLPYGITSNEWDSPLPLDKLWNLYDLILKPNGVIALTASQPFTSMLVMSNIKMFRHEWILIKNRGSNFANTVREPMKEHESLLIFSKGKWAYNKQMQERTGGGLDRTKYNVKFESKSENYREFEGRKKNKLSELRVPSSWQKFNTEVGLHPTQKPEPMCEYYIKTYTNEGDTVLDNCAGSGTTGEACIRLNRNYILMENVKKYYNTIQKRLRRVENEISERE